MAQDRNFSEECQLMINTHSKVFSHATLVSSLELFAGPAYHSACLADDFSIEISCIDASVEMRDIALSHYSINDNQYDVGLLPNCLKYDKKYDLIIMNN